MNRMLLFLSLVKKGEKKKDPGISVASFLGLVPLPYLLYPFAGKCHSTLFIYRSYKKHKNNPSTVPLIIVKTSVRVGS